MTNKKLIILALFLLIPATLLAGMIYAQRQLNRATFGCVQQEKELAINREECIKGAEKARYDLDVQDRALREKVSKQQELKRKEPENQERQTQLQGEVDEAKTALKKAQDQLQQAEIKRHDADKNHSMGPPLQSAVCHWENISVMLRLAFGMYLLSLLILGIYWSGRRRYQSMGSCSRPPSGDLRPTEARLQTLETLFANMEARLQAIETLLMDNTKK